MAVLVLLWVAVPALVLATERIWVLVLLLVPVLATARKRRLRPRSRRRSCPSRPSARLLA